MDTLSQNADATVVADKSGAARWTVDQVEALFNLPFNDLIYRAQTVHRQHFDANAVQMSTLLSIKTGGCPEDCSYCPQSAHHREVKLDRVDLLSTDEVLAAALARHPGEVVVVVSHADPIKAAVAAYTGMHLDHFQRILISPASVTGFAMTTHGSMMLACNDCGALEAFAAPGGAS